MQNAHTKLFHRFKFLKYGHAGMYHLNCFHLQYFLAHTFLKKVQEFYHIIACENNLKKFLYEKLLLIKAVCYFLL